MSWCTRRRRESGAAAVEFALVVPLLVAMILGIVEFGFAFNFRSQVSNYAMTAARSHSIDPTQDPTASAIAATLGVATSNVTVPSQPIVVDGGVAGDCGQTGNAGKNFTLTFQVTRPTMTKFFKPSFTYTGKGVGRCP